MDQWRSRLWSLQPDPASPRPRESSLTSSPLSPTLPSEVRYGGPVAGGQCRALLRRRRQCRVRSHLRRFSSLPSSGHARSTVAGGALLLTLLLFCSSSSSAMLLLSPFPSPQTSERDVCHLQTRSSFLSSSVRPPSASYALACAALLLLLLWYSIVAPQRNECTRPRRPPRP